MANSGWICPRCEVVHAPGVLRCECKAVPKVVPRMPEPESDLEKWARIERETLKPRCRWCGQRGEHFCMGEVPIAKPEGTCPSCGFVGGFSHLCTKWEATASRDVIREGDPRGVGAYERAMDWQKRQEAAKARAEGEG